MPRVFAFSDCFVKWPYTQDEGSAAIRYTGALSSALFSLVEPCVQVAVIEEGLIAGNVEEQKWEEG